MTFPSLIKLCITKIIQNDTIKVEKKYSMGEIIELKFADYIIFDRMNSNKLINEYRIVSTTFFFMKNFNNKNVSIFIPCDYVDIYLFGLISYKLNKYPMIFIFLNFLSSIDIRNNYRISYFFKNTIYGILFKWLKDNNAFEIISTYKLHNHYDLIQFNDNLEFIEKNFNIKKNFNENLNYISALKPDINIRIKKKWLIDYLMYNDIYIPKFNFKNMKQLPIIQYSENIMKQINKENYIFNLCLKEYKSKYNEENQRKDMIEVIYNRIIEGRFSLDNVDMSIFDTYPEYSITLKELIKP